MYANVLKINNEMCVVRMVIAILIIFQFLTPTIWGGGGGGGTNGGGGVNNGGVASSLTGNNNNNNNNGGSNSGNNGVGGDTTNSLASRVVYTKYGAVSGVIVHLEGRHLDPVEAYKGIPYASPPIGSLRFMPPVTGALWSGVKKADR